MVKAGELQKLATKVNGSPGALNDRPEALRKRIFSKGTTAAPSWPCRFYFASIPAADAILVRVTAGSIPALIG
jgi:hypothetical protein